MPNWNHIVRDHLAVLRLPPEREIEIVEELALHMEAVYEDALRVGLSEAEAEARAVQSYDWRLLECELSRAEQPLAARALQPSLELIERKGGIPMESFIQDLRFGARMLVKQPGFTLIAVLTLALGIGANTAMFSVVNAVLLRPLPFPEPDRLTLLTPEGVGNFAAPDFRDVATRNRSFERVGAYSDATFNLAGASEPERVNGARVSAGLLTTLGVRLLYGRDLTEEEEREGAARVVLLGHSLWQRQFGADPGVVGRVVRLDELSYTVIGVLPPGLNFPQDKELFVPLTLTAFDLNNYQGFFLKLIARLKPGVPRPQADAELATIIMPGGRGPRYRSVRALGLHEALVGDVRKMMLVLMGAVGFVALIACANLANLLLTAAARRQKEIAVRLSLGASRGRLVRQFLTESLLLAGLGGMAGLLLAYGGMTLINALLPSTIPRNGEISVDGRVLAFTFALTVLAGLLFGT